MPNMEQTQEKSGEVPDNGVESQVPQIGWHELTIHFTGEELDQVDSDAMFLMRRTLLRPDGDNQAARLQSFIRFAVLRHTHQAVQKMLGAEFQVVDENKKLVPELLRLRTSLQQREQELQQREMRLAQKETTLEELMVKWAALFPQTEGDKGEAT